MEKINLIKCPICKGSWFEEIRAFQVPDNFTLIPGQKVSVYQGMQYSVLRCLRCNELMEPPTQVSPRDLVKSQYGSMISELEDETWKVSKVKGEKI